MEAIHVSKTPTSVSASFVTDGKLSVASIDFLEGGRWWISRVNVQGAERGKGIGSQLLQKAIEEVLSFDPTEIIVAPGGYGEEPERQINFYKKNGFVKINNNGLMSFEKLHKKKVQEGEIIITDHAYQRAKERLSISKKSLDRLALTAYEKGIKQSDTAGQLKKYLDKLWFEHKTANNIRIYGEIIYLFCRNRLVTLFQIPPEFKKVLKHLR
jgi:hypothetical protein